MQNAMNVPMIVMLKDRWKMYQIHGGMYEDSTRAQVLNWSERACHLS